MEGPGKPPVQAPDKRPVKQPALKFPNATRAGRVARARIEQSKPELVERAERSVRAYYGREITAIKWDTGRVYVRRGDWDKLAVMGKRLIVIYTSVVRESRLGLSGIAIWDAVTNDVLALRAPSLRGKVIIYK